MPYPRPKPFAGAAPRGIIRRAGPLGTVILLHAGFFYALQSGLLQQTAQQAVPKEIIATFITPEPAPEPPRPPTPPTPEPPKPKTVPVVKKTVTPPKPVPAVNKTPSEKAISTPPAPPEPVAAEPAPPAYTPPAPPAPAAPPAPPAPAPAPAPAMPRTVTTGIEYLQKPNLEYPTVSRRMGEEGLVQVRVLVNDKGRPERAEIVKSSGSARLDEAGRKAAMGALFKPFMEDGKAVPAFAIIPFNFRLDS